MKKLIRFGSPRITKIWIEDDTAKDQVIRVDFDNDRHCRVEIPYPGNKEDIAYAFAKLADIIYHDKQLNKEQICFSKYGLDPQEE